jgi:hypothetical protein
MREIDDKPVQPRTQLRESSWPYREPIKIETPAKRSGLERVWSWLKKQVPAAQGKRMHLAENIALGEKRFVALVVVDGWEFLIGGGASSVSLLSQWESATNSQAAEKSPFRFRESSE